MLCRSFFPRNAECIDLQEFCYKNSSVKILGYDKEDKAYESFLLNSVFGQLWPSMGVMHNYIISVDNASYSIIQEKIPNYHLYYHFPLINDLFLHKRTPSNIAPSNLEIHESKNTIYVQGKVAIIDHVFYNQYGHYIADVLPKLAFLELQDIDYDYLIVPNSAQYMQDLLMLWGVDQSKIISLKADQRYCVDTLIFVTELGQIYNAYVGAAGDYHIKSFMQYVKNKLIAAVAKLSVNVATSPKIFISKKDSVVKERVITNEDEVFQEFEKLGYVRYECAKMSMIEKIYLFSKATHVVGVVGAGGFNAMFMAPGSTYIEIQHLRAESTFCYLMQDLDINYRCINGITWADMNPSGKIKSEDNFDISIVKNFIQYNADL